MDISQFSLRNNSYALGVIEFVVSNLVKCILRCVIFRSEEHSCILLNLCSQCNDKADALLTAAEHMKMTGPCMLPASVCFALALLFAYSRSQCVPASHLRIEKDTCVFPQKW